MFGNGQPPYAFGMAYDQLGTLGLSDGRHCVAVVGKVGQLLPAERVLVVTATAPMREQANQRNSISGELSRCTKT
jgi:hypothetical protein